MSEEYSATGRYLGRTQGTSRVQTPAHWEHLALGGGSCHLCHQPVVRNARMTKWYSMIQRSRYSHDGYREWITNEAKRYIAMLRDLWPHLVPSTALLALPNTPLYSFKQSQLAHCICTISTSGCFLANGYILASLSYLHRSPSVLHCSALRQIHRYLHLYFPRFSYRPLFSPSFCEGGEQLYAP